MAGLQRGCCLGGAFALRGGKCEVDAGGEAEFLEFGEVGRGEDAGCS